MFRSNTSSSLRIRSQPIKILEIPPYRKNQIKNNPTAVVNPSPPRISEIPPFKPRASIEWQPAPVVKTTKEPNQMSLTQTACPDWMHRLKATNSTTMHRSIDCLPANKDLPSTPVSSDPAKAAPSWIHIAEKQDSFSNPSSPPRKTPTEEESKGSLKTTISGMATIIKFILFPFAAAELAAKKSRVKQSLIKRARSVAIFSLKLKERRAREAEKQMEQNKVEFAVWSDFKSNLKINFDSNLLQLMNPGPVGGELDLIGIEQLIQIDDVYQNKN